MRTWHANMWHYMAITVLTMVSSKTSLCFCTARMVVMTVMCSWFRQLRKLASLHWGLMLSQGRCGWWLLGKHRA